MAWIKVVYISGYNIVGAELVFVMLVSITLVGV